MWSRPNQWGSLAATIPKIRALAERVDEVVVLAQSGDGDGLPANVEVRTFGAPSRVQRVWRFERELARALPADAVVAHMIPAYVVLAAPMVVRLFAVPDQLVTLR